MPWHVSFRFQNTEDCGPLLVQRHLGLAASPGLFLLSIRNVSVLFLHVSQVEGCAGTEQNWGTSCLIQCPWEVIYVETFTEHLQVPSTVPVTKRGAMEQPRSCTLQSLSCRIHEGIQDQYH